MHRLLRREEDQAPYEVVEGVRDACPRAMVRKQAVREEEDFMEDTTVVCPREEIYALLNHSGIRAGVL